MWISARFQLQVINAYDALVTGQIIPDFLKPVTRPMSLPEAEQYSKQLYGYVDELIKAVPVIVSLGDYQKQKKTQATIPGIDTLSNSNGLPKNNNGEHIRSRHKSGRVFAYKRWTPEDYALLEKRMQEGKRDWEIAEEMGRSTGSIESNWNRMKKAGAQ